MILSVSNASKSFGSQEVFENVTFTINEKDKIALVGRNGCGKTTLIKCLMGELNLDSGTINKTRTSTIGMLSQVVFENEAATIQEIMDEVFAPIYQLQAQLEAAQHALSYDTSEKAYATLERLTNEFENLGGYTIHSEMMNVLTQFGFTEADLNRSINTFSGGQKTRIGFAKLLLSKPDLLFLDEPTNHLDLPTIQWLEGYLKKYDKALVLVSHDRMFLDRIVDQVYEIEYAQLTCYNGNYTSFVEQKKKNFELQSKRYAIQQKEIQRLEALIEKFRYKATKAAFAQSKIKYLDRLDRIEDPRKSDDKQFKAEFSCARQGGKTVVEIDELTVGYDQPLFTWSTNILKGQRIALIGPNGCGKSTFLKTLIGKLEPLNGSFLLGHQIDIGYFDQANAQLSSNKTVLDELWDDYPMMSQTEIRTVLGRFLFSADDVFKSVSSCSGGEKVRLALAKLMLEKGNFLILDEPTNHLDIVGKETLEECLMNYPGTILFVSHDRYFIEKIATTIASIENGSVTLVEKFAINPGNSKNTKEKEETKKVEENPRIILINIEREIKKIEEQLEIANEELKQLRELRYEPEYYQDASKMQALDERIDDKHNEIVHLEDKWQTNMEIIEENS